MQTRALLFTLPLFFLACVFDSDEIVLPDDDSSTGDPGFRSASIWLACAEDPLEPGALLDDWGCDGKQDEWLACYVGADWLGDTVTICAPQVADPNVLVTCDGLPTGPTSGLTGPGPLSALCLPLCNAVTPCEPGYVCSTDGVCAVPW